MSALKTISDYYSEESNKRAVVMKDLTVGNYRVVVTNDSGSSFSSTFDFLEHAEEFAEDWVL